VQAALAEAEAEASAAQNAVNQLRDDVAANQQQAKEFATHLNEYKALREDLNHVEAMHRAGLDRLTKLQASELERAPRIDVVEAATSSQEPWRPNYRLDSLIAGAGSLVFGLFAIWLTELIAGPPASRGMLVQHTWVAPMLDAERASRSLPLSTPNAGQLPAPEPLPRELRDVEIVSLVSTATDNARFAVVALLMGLSEEELIALRWENVDLPGRLIRVSGEATRSVPLTEPLHGLLVSRRRAPTRMQLWFSMMLKAVSLKPAISAGWFSMLPMMPHSIGLTKLARRHSVIPIFAAWSVRASAPPTLPT